MCNRDNILTVPMDVLREGHPRRKTRGWWLDTDLFWRYRVDPSSENALAPCYQYLSLTNTSSLIKYKPWNQQS